MTDELDLLRRQRPDPPRPSEVTLAHARSELAEVIAAAGSSPSTPAERMHAPARTGPGGSRGRVARLLIAAAVIGLLAAGVALLRSGPSAQPALAAGVVLERLAQVAAKQPRTVPAPGHYLYTESQGLTGADTVLPGGRYCQAQFRQHRENWIAADGEGLVRETDGPAHYATAQEAAACGAIPQVSGTTNSWAAPQCLSIDPIPLAGLPRDPGRLRARLLTGKVEGGPPGPAEAFTQVGDLLRETNAPPALRAALYRAAAGLPGVKSLGTVHDELGRGAVALAIDTHGVRHELLFSQNTSMLQAERDVLVGHVRGTHAALGATLDWSAYSAPRVVNSLPAPSPLPLTPACVRGGERGLSVPGRPNDSVMVGSGEAALGRAR